MKRYFGLLLLFVFLSACGSAPDEPEILNAEELTNSPSISYFTKSTTTPSPIYTKAPWPTLPPLSTDNPFILIPELTSLPTRAPISEKLYIGYLSPNQKWMVFTAGRNLQIYHIGGSLIWEIPDLYQIANFDWLAWRQWSADSRFLYFSTAPSFGGGPFYDMLHNGDGAWRLDIVSGEIIELLPNSYEGDEMRLRFLALSPDETLLAYVNTLNPPFELVIIDIESGKELKRMEIGENYYSVGDIFWSPDSEKLVYYALRIDEMEDDRDFPKKISYLMFLFDLANNSQSFLLDTGWMDSGLEENVQRFMGWQDNGTLSFEIEMTCGKVSLFDIYKKEFTSEMYPAATPRPVFWPTPPVTPVGTICPPLPTPTASP